DYYCQVYDSSDVLF
nr:immunoglobulin light chain junction region [Macaca mulatta]MOV66616.1 immunoglobulin light chain junction region [Macaca mulatta]MOV67156.1 immunoglobulin light chain junction region [Macaca mulatta]MOV67303.1 immunoglobulin light chain junction region [Macaca mulatta]MOV69942.1 immunoglobulin light chain junction region [Macaca mulatta]